MQEFKSMFFQTNKNPLSHILCSTFCSINRTCLVCDFFFFNFKLWLFIREKEVTNNDWLNIKLEDFYSIPCLFKPFLIGLPWIFEKKNSCNMVENFFLKSNFIFITYYLFNFSFHLKTFSIFHNGRKLITLLTYSVFHFSKFILICYHGWRP